MAVVMSDNFDGSPGTAFLGDSTFTVSGNVSHVASHYGVGVQFRAGVASYLEQAITGTTTRVFSRIYRLNAFPSAHTQIFQVRSATGAICSASIRSTGQIGIHNGGSVASSLAATSVVPLNTDFRVVFALSGTTFTATVYPDLSSTTSVSAISGTVTGATMTAAREGNPSGTGTGDSALTLSWPIDDNSTDPGPRQFVYLSPSATSGVVPKTITAVVNAENLPAGVRTYTVDWGDGSASGPQAGSSFTHTFTRNGAWAMVPKVDVA